MLYCTKFLKMEHHEHNEDVVVKNYTATAISSFALIFLCLITFAQCHGPFVVKDAHHSSGAEHHKTEHHNTPSTHH